MAQLNVYIPDDLEATIRSEAKREGKSVSAFVLEAVRNKLQPHCWSAAFLSLLETEPLDGFPEDIEDLPAQKRKGLDDL